MKRAGDFDWKLLESVTEKETGNAQSGACVDVLPRCLLDVTNGRIPYLGNLVPMALSSYSPPPRELWEQGCHFGFVTANYL